jgi:hypothetical protein
MSSVSVRDGGEESSRRESAGELPLVASWKRLRQLASAGEERTATPPLKVRRVSFKSVAAVDTSRRGRVVAYIAALHAAHGETLAATPEALRIVRQRLDGFDVENADALRVRLEDLLDSDCRHWMRTIFNEPEPVASAPPTSPIGAADVSIDASSPSSPPPTPRVHIQMLVGGSSLEFNGDCLASIVVRALRDIYYAAGGAAALDEAPGAEAENSPPPPLFPAHRFLLRLFSDPAVLHDATHGAPSLSSPGASSGDALERSSAVGAAWAALRKSIAIGVELHSDHLAPLVPLLDVRGLVVAIAARAEAEERQKRAARKKGGRSALASSVVRRRGGAKGKRQRASAKGKHQDLVPAAAFVFPSLRFRVQRYRSEWLCPHCAKVVLCRGGAPECACAKCGQYVHRKCHRTHARGADRFDASPHTCARCAP